MSNRLLTARSRPMVELNTQDMLLSGDSQQLRRREQKFVSLRENCLFSLAGERTQKWTPQVGAFWIEDASHMSVNTPCKQCVKYHAVNKGRRRKKKEGRTEEGRRKKMGRQPS